MKTRPLASNQQSEHGTWALRAWQRLSSPRCWALEFGPSTLRLVGLRRTREGATLETLACARLLPEQRSMQAAEYRLRAQETLAAWRRTYRLSRESRLAVVVPALRGTITTLHLPRVDAQRLDELVRLEVEVERPEPQGGEERVVRWREEAGPTETTGRTLIAAWPRSILASHLDLLDSAGLSADRVTFAPLADRAFLGFLQHNEGSDTWRPDDNLWTLRVGETLVDWSRSTYEGFASTTHTGGMMRLHQLLQHELELDSSRARVIAEDLQRGVPPPNASVQAALDLYLDELVQKLLEERDRKPLSASPSRLLLLGTGGALHGLAARLERAFEVTVKQLAHYPRLEICVGCDGHLRTELGDFVSGIGAALSLEWEAAPLVDLAPRDHGKRARRGANLRLALAGGLLLAAGVLESRRALCTPEDRGAAPALVAAREGHTRWLAFGVRAAQLEHAGKIEELMARRQAGWISCWSSLPESARILGAHWRDAGSGAEVDLDISMPVPAQSSAASGSAIAAALLEGPLAGWLEALRPKESNAEAAVRSASWQLATEATRSAPDPADAQRWRLSLRLLEQVDFELDPTLPIEADVESTAPQTAEEGR